MKTPTFKYFLAIIPPSPVYEELVGFKKHICDAYHCKAPLRSPPHITLHMPWVMKSAKEVALVEKLRSFSEDQTAFDVSLEGFGAFPPRVIYAALSDTQALKSFQAGLSRFARRELGLFNANRKDRGYEPHITLAVRDLKKAAFPGAWDDFSQKPFEARFLVSSFWLLKYDGQTWALCEEFRLAV